MKHKFVKNTNMSISNICTSELTGPQFPAGIEESQDSGPGPTLHTSREGKLYYNSWMQGRSQTVTGAREEHQRGPKGAPKGPQKSPGSGSGKGPRRAEEVAFGVLEKEENKQELKKRPQRGLSGGGISASQPQGGAQEGAQKGRRRCS
jgi:hypothetical protein